MISGVAYTGGPYQLGYHGLGDLFVMVFLGFVAVVGTVFVQTQAAPLLAWVAAIPVGAIGTGILVVNNLRDRETNIAAGKHTLAVRLGRRGAIAEYALLTIDTPDVRREELLVRALAAEPPVRWVRSAAWGAARSTAGCSRTAAALASIRPPTLRVAARRARAGSALGQGMPRI